MSFVDEFMRALNEDSPGVRVLSGEELTKLLKGKLADCGNPECPVHGGEPDPNGIITSEQLENMTPEDMELRALGFTAGAHNMLLRKELKKAELAQNQAALWMEMADRDRALQAAQEEQNAEEPPKE